ncbi:hypothetical protein EYB35_07385 [Bacillus paranthracis]|nr:hypothetical protein EYB35_07385 [Bacillus paranthracis]
MQARFNKFSPENIVLGSGTGIFFNWTHGEDKMLDVGATQGDLSFTYTPSLEPIKARGVRGNVKGLQYVSESETKMKAGYLEWIRKDLIQHFLLNAQITEYTHDGSEEGKAKGKGVIIRGNEDLMNNCGKDAYIDDITVIGRSNDGNVYRITMFNALPTSGFEAVFGETEVAPEVEFTGHNDPNDPMTPPFEIEIFEPDGKCAPDFEKPNEARVFIDSDKLED